MNQEITMAVAGLQHFLYFISETFLTKKQVFLQWSHHCLAAGIRFSTCGLLCFCDTGHGWRVRWQVSGEALLHYRQIVCSYSHSLTNSCKWNCNFLSSHIQTPSVWSKLQRAMDGKSSVGAKLRHPYQLSGKVQYILDGHHGKSDNRHSSFGWPVGQFTPVVSGKDQNHKIIKSSQKKPTTKKCPTPPKNIEASKHLQKTTENKIKP